MIPLEIVAEIDSTSDELKRRLGQVGELALLARRQTGGRGRLGRRWETIDGNLHLSVLLRPGPLRWPGHWSLLAGVALAEAVAACLPNVLGLRLKWPNDLMLDGGKLAGILVEAGQGAAPWLVIGFGVNLAGAPAGLGRATACLAEHAPPPPEVFVPHLLATLQAWRQRYAEEGFDPVRAAWLERAPAIGAALSVASPPKPSLSGRGLGEGGSARRGPHPGPLPEQEGGRMEGRFAGLSSSGGLLLETAAGLVTIVAGELA